jgi:uncharacterized protein YheU (UPF0270 family)
MGIVIPHQQLSAEALLGVIENYINREGTDYGENVVDLDTKVAQVRGQLDNGKIVLLYDEESATINIITAEAYRKATEDPL